MTSHWHSAIVVKGVNRLECTTLSVVSVHQDSMRILAIDQRSGCLCSGARHSAWYLKIIVCAERHHDNDDYNCQRDDGAVKV
jgi:hypothetical protein